MQKSKFKKGKVGNYSKLESESIEGEKIQIDPRDELPSGIQMPDKPWSNQPLGHLIPEPGNYNKNQ